MQALPLAVTLLLFVIIALAVSGNLGIVVVGIGVPVGFGFLIYYAIKNHTPRNVSTTLIHPGSEFKLGIAASIERLLSGQDCRLWSRLWPFDDRTAVVRGSAWRYVTEHSGSGP